MLAIFRYLPSLLWFRLTYSTRDETTTGPPERTGDLSSVPSHNLDTLEVTTSEDLRRQTSQTYVDRDFLGGKGDPEVVPRDLLPHTSPATLRPWRARRVNGHTDLQDPGSEDRRKDPSSSSDRGWILTLWSLVRGRPHHTLSRVTSGSSTNLSEVPSFPRLFQKSSQKLSQRRIQTHETSQLKWDKATNPVLKRGLQKNLRLVSSVL